MIQNQICKFIGGFFRNYIKTIWEVVTPVRNIRYTVKHFTYFLTFPEIIIIYK